MGMRIWRFLLLGLAAFATAAPAGAQTEIVFVEESDWPFNEGIGNPGSGDGLEDWNDFYNSDWRCPRIPGGGIAANCGRDNPVDPPAWDVPEAAFIGRSTLTSPIPFPQNLFAGLLAVNETGDPSRDPYDPSAQGEILSVRGTFAIRMEASNAQSSVTAHLMIEQDGSYYISDQSTKAQISSGGGPAPWIEFGKSGGEPIDFGVTDFDRVLPDESVDSSQHPDFASSAPPLRFGFAVNLQVQSIPNPPGFLNRFYDVDGLRISVMTPSPSVPMPGLAPAGAAVLCALLGSLGAHGAWRERKRGAGRARP